MRRLFISPLHFILIGALFIFVGLILVAEPAPVQAQDGDTPTADYIGSSDCADCHKDMARIHADSAHGRALVDVSKNKDLIKADFSKGDTERTVTFPEETSPRPFTKDDINFVIGSGRYVERYVYLIERGKYAIFPAEWDVEKQQWQPYAAKEGDWPTSAAYDFVSNCAGCHTTGLNLERGRWRDEGVQCESCHGPGSIHQDLAKDARGDDVAPEVLTKVRSAIWTGSDPQVCGQCHSQGTNTAAGLPYPTTYRPGQNLLDPSVFTLVPEEDAVHWWVKGHAKSPNMQYNEWLQDGHAKALTTLKGSTNASQNCLSCHSGDYNAVNAQIEAVKAGDRKGLAPAALTLETAQYGVTCTSCHDPHLKTTDATPPTDFSLVADPYTLCTSCHSDNFITTGPHHPVKEMFEGIQVIEQVQGEPSQHFTTTDGPRCVTCHMPSLQVGSEQRATHFTSPIQPDQTIGVDGLKDACSTCHDDVAPDAMQDFIKDTQDTTSERLKAAHTALAAKTDSPAWVTTALAFIEGDGSLGVHNYRYVAALLTAVETQLDIFEAPPSSGPAPHPVLDPAQCAECHQEQHANWISSPHANSSLNDRFRKEYAKLNQPSYCMSCHASGYDIATNKYVFEGVVCSTCHYTENDAKHPPAPFKIANQSEACGACHSGAHAPTYDEWLVSAHNAAKIDCVDCHTPHDNGFVTGDINTTCGNCHKDSLKDKVHMGKDATTGKDFTCVDCHMTQKRDESGVFAVKTGHSMAVEPSTCATCHGDIHTLQLRANDGSTPVPAADVENLQAQLATLQDTAQVNWATGIAGGSVGMLFIIGLSALILRRRRVK